MKRIHADWLTRGNRRAVHLNAGVFWPDGRSAICKLSNVSYDGCELCSVEGFKKGETVKIAVPGMGKIEAQIRWIKEDRAGVRFLTGTSVPDERRARLGI